MLVRLNLFIMAVAHGRCTRGCKMSRELNYRFYSITLLSMHISRSSKSKNNSSRDSSSPASRLYTTHSASGYHLYAPCPAPASTLVNMCMPSWEQMVTQICRSLGSCQRSDNLVSQAAPAMLNFSQACRCKF